MNNNVKDMFGFGAIFSFLFASLSSSNITGNVIGANDAALTGVFFVVLGLFLSFIYILIKN